MNWNSLGVFSIVVFPFYAAYKIITFSVMVTIGLPLQLMMVDDAARSLKRWENTL
tara:strand:- start:174 stop:338 length:165 start_codon:yes stop_codon:yes gene_type:complete